MFDNDEDDKWLNEQAAQAEVAQPSAASEQPGRWAKAQELMSRQAGMKYEAPENLRKPITAEPVPENKNQWGTVAAMLLDLMGSRGQNIGNIAQGAVNNRNQQLRDWRKENSPAALQQREMQQIQMRNADRQSFDADRAALGQQAQQEMQIANAEQGQENFQGQQIMAAANHEDQVNYQNKSLEQQAAQSAANLAMQKQNHQDSINMQRAQMGQAARFHQDALQQHLNDQDNQLNRDRDQAAQAQRAQEALFAHQDATNAADNQTKKDVYALSHPTPVAPQGWRVKQGQEQQFNQAMGSPAIMKEVLTQAGTHKGVESTLDELIRLRGEPGSEANRKLYDAALKSLIGDRSKEGSTGVLSGQEFERYLADLPEYGAMANMSTWRGIRDSFAGGNPALETLKGIKTRYHDKAASTMMPYGIEYEDTPAANGGGSSMALQPTDTKDLLGGIPGLKKSRR